MTGTGGTSTGGTTPATGGSATGGNSTSGMGGSATGGAATGGAATGGAATGGTSPISTGGAATGGASSASTGGMMTTGGAATGGAATGGAGTGGATSTPVVPTKVSNSDYKFTLGSVVLDVNPMVGARVTSLTFGSTNILVPYACASYDGNSTCNDSGSTFWTSPQTAWGWPPLAAIDGNAYTPTVSGNQLTLKGSADATLGAGVTKVISADSGTGWITLTYTIDATKAIQAAPWQITRVPRGGLVLFPLTSIITNSNSFTTWTLSPSGGYEWIDDSTQTTVQSPGPKIIADGGVAGQTTTWLAYVLGGNLLLIKYPNVQAGSFAPNEGDTEAYPGAGYIELEAQGTYAPIAANTSSALWTVQWRVVTVPSGVTVAAASASLLSFVQQQAAM